MQRKSADVQNTYSHFKLKICISSRETHPIAHQVSTSFVTAANKKTVQIVHEKWCCSLLTSSLLSLYTTLEVFNVDLQSQQYAMYS
jgi:hypothetical protein